MSATVQAQCATGAGPTLTNCESGLKYSRGDGVNADTTPIPIPASTGEKYSYLRYIGLVVTGTSSTSLSNRRIAQSGALSTGLYLYFQGQSTYTQNTGTQGTGAGQYPADVASNNTTPSGYTLMSTSNQVWDSSSVSAGSTGVNGKYCQTVFGVDNTFTGGAGSATSLNNLLALYDEM